MAVSKMCARARLAAEGVTEGFEDEDELGHGRGSKWREVPPHCAVIYRRCEDEAEMAKTRQIDADIRGVSRIGD